MKARTKLEKELQAVIDGGKLSPLTPKQMEQARIIMDRQKGCREFVMHAEQTISGMKLVKCYKVHRYGKGSQMTFFNLVLIKAEKDDRIMWAARNCNMGVLDSFSHNGPLTIKDERFFYNDYVRCGWPLRSIGKAYPYAVVRHFNLNDYEFRDSRIETLSKCGGEMLLQHIMRREKALADHVWAAYKVAVRHGYNFQGELWRWIDMVDMLKLNKKDYRNPVFVCPANLMDAYQSIIDINDKRIRLLAALRDERKAQKDAEAKEKQFQEALKFNDTYIAQHKKLLGIVIVGRGITIKPLQNITEFRDEGEAMHHCVYSNAYYKKRDSLIMSVRDGKGKRLATIEYDLKRQAVAQCRAACNQQPKRYNEIMSLVQSHARDFKKAQKKKGVMA